MRRGRMGARGQQRPGRTTRPRRAGIGVLVTVTALLGAAGTEPARAGTYVMRNCNVPGQPYAPLGPWTIPEGIHPEITMNDNCATGGGVTFDLAEPRELPGGGFRTIGLYRPVGPRSGIKLVKALLWYAARLAGSGQPLSFWTGDYHSDAWLNPGLSNGPPGSENLVGEQQLSPGTVQFRVGLGCGPEPSSVAGPPCVAATRVPLIIRGMEVTLSEDVPPAVLRPTGTLLAGGPQRGVRSVSYAASDPHAGLAKVEILLGDLVVKSHDLTPRCFYSDFTVCPAVDDETLEVDTRAVPNGLYELSVRVRDAAGNERVVRGERAVEVANESPAESINGPAYAIAMSFKGSSRAKLTVPYGRRVSLRGRLTRGSQPVAAGTSVEVLERLDRRGAPERRTRTVLTRVDGAFSIGLATSRPSRVVRVAYRLVSGGLVVSKAVRLQVRAASRVRAKLHGRIIRFSGRVLSGPIPKRGKRVDMEGRSPGSAWTPFKNLRTDTKGRFSGTYRLRVRRPGVVLKIRAGVPSEAGYGYLGSSSRAVTLRVR